MTDFSEGAAHVYGELVPIREAKISLLDWRDGAINQNQIDLFGFDPDLKFFNLALPEKFTRAGSRQSHDLATNNR